MPHLVCGVHHLQQHGLLVHQLLRGVGVLCKEKGGWEDGLGRPVFSKAKQSPGCLGRCGKSSSPDEERPPLAPPTSLRPETTLFGGLVVRPRGETSWEQPFPPTCHKRGLPWEKEEGKEPGMAIAAPEPQPLSKSHDRAR